MVCVRDVSHGDIIEEEKVRSPDKYCYMITLSMIEWKIK